MIALVGRLLRLFGRYTVFVFLLLLLTLGSIVYGLYDVNRNLDLLLLIEVSIGGIIIGWLFGRSKVSAWVCWPAALLMGVIITMLKLGRLVEPVIRLLSNLFSFSVAISNWFVEGRLSLPDQNPLWRVLNNIGGIVSIMVNRLQAWVIGVRNNSPTYDAMVNSLLWGLLLWVLVVWAAWMVRRYAQPLWGLAPAGVLLAGVVNYVRSSHIAILPFLGGALFLMIIVSHWKRESNWIKNNIDYSTEIRADTALTTIPMVVVLIVLTIITPSISIHQIIEFAQSLVEKQPPQVQQVGQSLGLEARPRESSKPGPVGGGLPRGYLLGTGADLSRRVVMTVLVGAVQPPIDPNNPPPFYWRALTYDQYNGHGWDSSATEIQNYKAGELAIIWPVKTPRTLRVSLVTQQIRGRISLNRVLYRAGNLITTDQDFQITWRTPRDAGDDEFGASINRNTYTAQSMLAMPSLEDLRSSGTDYPTWVLERYLQLPDTVPQRVIALAQNLTTNQFTPYAKAQALENYLRTIPYTLDVPAPPSDRDVVDFFLFDVYRGYCDYYATAMVVLARSAGIPARLVMGYARGSYDENTHQYLVTEADAHSWVEVYFPGIGWVEFEPTAGRGAIVRPEKTAAGNITPIQLEPFQLKWYSNYQGIISTWAIRILVGLLVVIILWDTTDDWLLHHIKTTRVITWLYRRVRKRGLRILRRTSANPHVGETPYEFSKTLTNRVNVQAQRKILSNFLKPVQREVERLVQLYARAIYSLHPPRREELDQAIKTWHRLRWRLWLASLTRKSKLDV